MEALAFFPSPRVERSLMDIVSGGERAYLRAAALNTYSAIRGHDALPLLEKSLADKDEIVRISAIRGLGRVGGDKAGAILQGAMESEKDPVARDAMARSLKKATAR